MTKQEARAAARALWRQFDADALRRQGAAMAEALLAQGAWQQADAVFCFVPMPTEPDLTPVLAAACGSPRSNRSPPRRPTACSNRRVMRRASGRSFSARGRWP